jgi:hypothetical protein
MRAIMPEKSERDRELDEYLSKMKEQPEER